MIRATSGDRPFVYSDGVTEAPNGKGELFGGQRLMAAPDANARTPVSRLKTAVPGAVRRGAVNGLTHDDVTFIAMEVGWTARGEQQLNGGSERSIDAARPASPA